MCNYYWNRFTTKSSKPGSGHWGRGRDHTRYFYGGNFQKTFKYDLLICLQVATTISRGDTLVLMIHRFDPVQGQSMQVIYFRCRIIVPYWYRELTSLVNNSSD
jgi:hypothetical protein